MHENIRLRLQEHVCGTDFDVYVFTVHTYAHWGFFPFGKYKLELQR